MLYRLSYTRVEITIAFGARFATGLAAGARSEQQALSGRVGYGAIGAGHGCFRHARRLLVAAAHDVVHRVACRQKVIGDDAPVALPPESLRAEDCANLHPPKRAQLAQAEPEFPGRGVIRVIAEVFIVPKAVRRGAAPFFA